MDENLDARLRAIEEKLDETYSMVRKMRRTQRNANFLKLFYWGILILVGLGAFYYVRPFLEQLKGIYTFGSPAESGQGINGAIEQIKAYKELMQ